MNNFLGSFLNITLQGDVVVEDDLEKDELLFLLVLLAEECSPFLFKSATLELEEY